MSRVAAADLARLIDLVELFPSQSIIVLGDFVADEFVFGEISRVSREAPVLILRHREARCLPGGGANAVNNLADLGAQVRPVSALGDDAAGDALVAYFQAKAVDVSGVVRVRGWATPTKTRFLAGWMHSPRQQVLRVDREPGELPDDARKLLAGNARERFGGASAMIVSDYGYGISAPAILRTLHGRNAGGKNGRELKGADRGANDKRYPRVVTLDSRYRLHEYAGLGITAATPNEAELEAANGASIGADSAQLDRIAHLTMAKLRVPSLVVTRGRDGMQIFERGQPPHSLPVFGSDQAVDVTGAGDTVIAAFTLAMSAGGTVLEAAQIANYAGGIVVMKRGTATVKREELVAAIRAEATGEVVAVAPQLATGPTG